MKVTYYKIYILKKEEKKEERFFFFSFRDQKTLSNFHLFQSNILI